MYALGNDTVWVANSVISRDRLDIFPEYWFILFFWLLFLIILTLNLGIIIESQSKCWANPMLHNWKETIFAMSVAHKFHCVFKLFKGRGRLKIIPPFA